MWGAGGRWERLITYISVIDGGAETRFFGERLMMEVTIVDVEKCSWHGSYDCLLEE